MPSPTRRTVLTLGALAGALLTAACTTDGKDPKRTARPDPDLPLRARAVAATDTLLAAYDAVLPGAAADLTDRLRRQRADVAVHRVLLARALPSPSPDRSPSPSPDRSGAPSPSAAPTRPAVRTVAELAAAERATAGARLADLEAASPALARLLAAVSACGALHAAALGDHGPVTAAPAASPTVTAAPPAAASPSATEAVPTASAGAAAVPAEAVPALQTALAAEHAAVYGYGVVGARMPAGAQRDDARASYTAHQARRDALQRLVAAAGASPAAAAAGYRLPFAVPDTATALRLAAHLETQLTAVWADAVASTTGALRRTAADALRDTALRAVHWGADLTAVPGLPDTAAAGTASGGPSARTPSGTAPGA